MGEPQPHPPRPGAAAGPGRLLLAMALLGGLAVLAIGLAVLARRGSVSEARSVSVVGSGLPQAWQPGEGGVGGAPPLPPGGASPPSGEVPPPPAPRQAALPTAPPEGEEPALEPPPTPPPFAGPEVVEDEPAPVVAYTPPRLRHLPRPSYPRRARRLGIEATVVLRVLVDADGRVQEAEPIGEPIGYGLEAAAMDAAYDATFVPALRDGQPEEGETRVAVRFRLYQ